MNRQSLLERCRNDDVRQTMIENLAYIIETRDEDTCGHIQRTSRFVGAFVHEVARDMETAHDVCWAEVVRRFCVLGYSGKRKENLRPEEM